MKSATDKFTIALDRWNFPCVSVGDWLRRWNSSSGCRLLFSWRIGTVDVGLIQLLSLWSVVCVSAEFRKRRFAIVFWDRTVPEGLTTEVDELVLLEEFRVIRDFETLV